MIQFSNVSKSYGADTLFEGVTMTMSRGEKLALVGRNGSGKSTLFKLIIGTESPDSGTVTKPRDYRIGHLPQHLVFNEKNIIQEVCLGLPLDERDQEYRAEILLSGLGFSEADMQLPASRFSGGFQIRINLARVLVSEPNMVLLDEPTNYLDIVSARWLTGYLQDWENEFIIISHDREFLDAVSTHTAAIHRGNIRKVAGSTEKLYDDIAIQEELYEKTRINEDKKRKQVEVFINRFRAQAAKAKAVQSRIKELARMGKKDALEEEESLDFYFTETETFHGKSLLDASELKFAYKEPVEENLLIKDLSFSVGKNDRIGIIGKNGKGKSTLLQLLSEDLKPSSGSITKSIHTKLGFFGQTNISRLNPKRTIEQEIESENPLLSRTRVRNICGTMMFSGDDALKKIGVLSGGEKSRVLLGKILATPTNLLLLDEPTNHLDMESIEALIESIENYSGAVVMVTHSEEILRRTVNRLIVFQGEKPFVFEGDYDYFLSKIGWEDEGGVVTAPSASASKSGKKQLTPEEQKEKDKKIKTIENKIIASEKKSVQAEEHLAEASTIGDRDKIMIFSKKLAEIKEEIEKLYEELEAL